MPDTTPVASSSSIKGKLVPYLTKASHLPTPFLSAFLLVHLSAPLVATVGGSELSSQVMLLGREYYQGQVSEILVVFAPLAVHVGASFLKRLCLPDPFRAPKTLLSATASLSVLLVPIHILINRLFPTIEQSPIASLGPSQLDFEFVKFGLQNWPWRSALLYGGLVGGVLLHALEGSALLWDTYIGTRGQRWKKSEILKRRAMGTLGILASFASLLIIFREPILTPIPSLLRRFEAVYKSSFIFRI